MNAPSTILMHVSIDPFDVGTIPHLKTTVELHPGVPIPRTEERIELIAGFPNWEAVVSTVWHRYEPTEPGGVMRLVEVTVHADLEQPERSVDWPQHTLEEFLEQVRGLGWQEA